MGLESVGRGRGGHEAPPVQPASEASLIRMGREAAFVGPESSVSSEALDSWG